MRPKCCRNESFPPGAPGGQGRPGGQGGSRGRGGWSLLAGSALILALWLGVLPRVGDQPRVSRRIEFLRQRQVDPSAMFYTEVEAMAGVRERMAAVQREHGSRFWTTAGRQDPPPPPTPD